MIFKKLEAKPVPVANKAGKTGTIKYWAYGYVGRDRVRKPLDTGRAGVADTRVEWIKRACEEGAGSGYWAQLKDCLPAKSFTYFAALVGYKEFSTAAKVEATWAGLRASYVAALDTKILNDAMTESTKATYLQSLKEFDKFVTLRGFNTLADITEKVIAEDFKPWRKKAILARVNAGTKAKRLAFDLTILRAAFSHTKSDKWLEAGYEVVKNPVPTMKRDQKPGANPENKTEPFTPVELAQLRAAANLKTHADSQKRKYSLPHGTDLLAFELLLRTGLRRCDAATLRWEHIRFDLAGGMIRVSAKKNGEDIFMPIHSELALLLRAEKARRNPRQHETVLLNPMTGQAYDLEGKGLYRRMLALGERLGILKVRPHRFRCSFAVDALLKGATPLQISEWLGDTVETVVAHYLPLSTAMSAGTRSTLERTDAGIEALHSAQVTQQETLLKSQWVA